MAANVALVDLIADLGPMADETLIGRDIPLSDIIREAKLTPTERAIAERRIIADDPETHKNIADSVGVSRQRIHQLEEVVIGKLRKSYARLERGEDKR